MLRDGPGDRGHGRPFVISGELAADLEAGVRGLARLGQILFFLKGFCALKQHFGADAGNLRIAGADALHLLNRPVDDREHVLDDADPDALDVSQHLGHFRGEVIDRALRDFVIGGCGVLRDPGHHAQCGGSEEQDAKYHRSGADEDVPSLRPAVRRRDI